MRMLALCFLLSGVFIILYKNLKQTGPKKVYKRFDYVDQEYKHKFESNRQEGNIECDPERRHQILCAVFTQPSHFFDHTLAVQQTWGKQCDTLLFVTSINYLHLPKPRDVQFLYLNISDSYQRLTIKTIKTILYAASEASLTFDWLVKADDDTLIYVPNLREYLSRQCANSRTKYFGHRVDEAFNSGGAGYVLHRQVVQAFATAYYDNSTFCKTSFMGFEDCELAACLKHIGVTPADTRDSHGLHRFASHSFYYHKRKGPIMSQQVISFHWLSSYYMRRVYDIITDTRLFKAKQTALAQSLIV